MRMSFQVKLAVGVAVVLVGAALAQRQPLPFGGGGFGQGGAAMLMMNKGVQEELKLTDQQKHYAASDVLHLHALKAKLDAMLEREGRLTEAQACFAFLGTRAGLDLAGFAEMDIFAH